MHDSRMGYVFIVAEVSLAAGRYRDSPKLDQVSGAGNVVRDYARCHPVTRMLDNIF